MREERVLKSSEVECTGRNKGGCRKTLMAQGSRERERDGKEEAVGDKKQKNKVKKQSARKIQRMFLSLLQAPQFCQQWHLYLLNALLMLRHICCCKLLLRPILGNGKKDWDVGQSAAGSFWFRQFLFL